MSDLQLVTPRTDAEWDAFHSIREEVLWEGRGSFGVYDRNHSDDKKEGNYPKLLLNGDVPIGVVRIDLNEDVGEAIFRRVAITEGEQRKGYGTKLMEMAENFAVGKGCDQFIANVALDAVPFYEKLGYLLDKDSEQPDPQNPRMVKKG